MGKKKKRKSKAKSKKVAKKKKKRVISKKLVAKGTRKPAAKRKSASSTSLAPTDPLFQAYLKEVHRHPLLTKEEERDLAIRFFEGNDRQAFQTLVTSNLRFVIKIAYEYLNYRLKLLDLVQEGNMGLVKAVQEFNPYKGVRLNTYAVWWIRSYIQDYILKNFSLVKIGTTQAQKKLFYRLRREQERLAQQGVGREESVRLLASKFDVKEKEVREMSQRMAGSDFSLNAPTGGAGGEEGRQQQHVDRLEAEGETADEVLGEAEQRERFSAILKGFSAELEGREKAIFEERLIAEKPATLKDLGERYGVSKERARQIEEGIKAKLRAYVSKHYPDYAILEGDS